MNRFGFVTVLPANTVKHVRVIVVSDDQRVREEQIGRPYHSASRLSLKGRRLLGS